MIIWINGTFGVGKTTTARALIDRTTDWRMFDPEHVGALLSANLRDRDFDDFQDLPPWRALVPIVGAAIHRFTGPTATIAVQSVLVSDYWDELIGGFAEQGMRVFHVVLDCDERELRRRVTTDQDEPDAADWRLDHIGRARVARTWMTERADLVIDTTELGPAQVAERIAVAVDHRMAGDDEVTS